MCICLLYVISLSLSIYIYICRYRERERDRCTHTYRQHLFNLCLVVYLHVMFMIVCWTPMARGNKGGAFGRSSGADSACLVRC